MLEMRRHYTSYFKGLNHFKEYRTQLVTLNNLDDLYAVIEEISEKYSLEAVSI